VGFTRKNRTAAARRKRAEEAAEALRKGGDGKHQMTTEEAMRLMRGDDWGTGRLEEGPGDPVDERYIEEARAAYQREKKDASSLD